MKELPINQIINGDCLEVMKEMPDQAIDMIITSPPYWGLRDYGVEQIFGGDKDCEHEWALKEGKELKLTTGKNSQCVRPWRKLATTKMPDSGFCLKCHAWKGQLGLEPTPEMYIEHLTEIFNEVKRVLKKTGTLWLNIGDTYSGSNCGSNDYREQDGLGTNPQLRYKGQKAGNANLPSKCLCMIPERLSWSLIQNGWILRNKIIWYKPNGMPSSVKDRFSNKWEYVFMFSKSQRYYFDLDGVREAYAESTFQRVSQNEGNPKWDGDHKRGSPMGEHTLDPKQFTHPKGKNPGDVWEIGTVPCPIKGIHFATFPEDLCRKAIIPGCPEEVCKKCGKPRERIIERTGYPDPENNIDTQGRRKSSGEIATDTGRRKTLSGKKHADFKRKHPDKFIGWTSCDCNAGFEGGILLDPFCGVGTACYVARRLRRRFIGIDIKPEYCEKADKIRLAQGVL